MTDKMPIELTRHEQAVCAMALWHAASCFPVNTATHALYINLGNKIENALKLEEGETDDAMSAVSKSLAS